MRNKLFILCFLAFSFVSRLFAQTGISPPDNGLFNKAVACIKEHEGWHGNHLPYVGYGHKILPHEKLTADMTEAQADSLLRADLRKLHKMCSRFGKDALLIATLTYNVGYYRLVGYGKMPKSRLIQNWNPATGISTRSISRSDVIRERWCRALSDGGRRNSDCCTYLNKQTLIPLR